MRIGWLVIVALIVFGLMAWNFLSGQPLVGGSLPGACMVLITLTLVVWYEADGRQE